MFSTYEYNNKPNDSSVFCLQHISLNLSMTGAALRMLKIFEAYENQPRPPLIEVHVALFCVYVFLNSHKLVAMRHIIRTYRRLL